jgi:hypothetical protein
LAENQAAAIEKRALDNVSREQRRWLEMVKNLGDSKSAEDMQHVAENSKEIGIFDGIEDDLNAEQLTKFEQWVEEKEAAELREFEESIAYAELEHVQRALRLTDGQKQKAYEIFLEEVESLPDDPLDPARAVDFDVQRRLELLDRLRRFAEFLSDEELLIYRQHLEKELKINLD